MRRGTSVLLLALVLGCALLSSGLRVGYTHDSIHYWSAIRNLSQGRGLTSGILYAERLILRGNPDGAPAEPGEAEGRPRDRHLFSAWPPGYPLLIFGVMQVLGTDIDRAALCVNLLSLLGCAVLLSLLGSRLVGPRTGAIAAASLCVLPVVQLAARRVLSDLVFCALTLGGLLCLCCFLSRPARRGVHFVLACLLFFAATCTRYLGVIGYGVAILVALLVVRTRRGGGAALVVGLLSYPLFLGVQLLHNLHASGQLGGAARLPSDRGLLTNTLDTLRACFSLVPIVRALPGPWDSAISAGVLGLCAAGLLHLYRASLARKERAMVFFRSETAWVLLSFGVLYPAGLIVLRTRSYFDPIDGRLLLPALLPLGLCVGGLLSATLRPIEQKNARTLRGGLCALFLLTGLCASLSDGRKNAPHWLGYRADAEREREVARLARGLPPEVLLFTDRLIEVHFASGLPVHYLPALGSLPLLRRPGAPPLVFVLGDGTHYFGGAERRRAYEAALQAIAGRVERGEGYTAYFSP